MVRPSGRLPARALLALTLVTAACSTSPSTSPSTESTPSTAPVDIVERFTAAILDPDLIGTAEITGSLSIGGQSGTISGSAEFSGEVSHQVLTVSMAQTTVQTEHLRILGNKQYTRTANGPWLLDEDGDGGATFQSQMVDLVADLRDEGVEQVDGEQLRHLVPATAVELSADSFGLEAAAVADFAGAAEFYARPDGTPAILSFGLTWTQAASSAEMEIRYVLDLEATPTFQRPDEVWVSFDSDRYGYRMAYPQLWATEQLDEQGQAFDLFYLKGASEVQVHYYAGIEGATAADWFADSASGMAEGYAAPVETSEPITIDGVEGRYFALHFDADGTNLFHQEAVLFAGSQAWELWWFSASGAEARDRATFELFAVTFQRALKSTAAGNVWALQPGDCFSSLPLGVGGGTSVGFFGGVDAFRAVDCTQPHTGELMEILADVSVEACEAIFEDYVGLALDGSEYDLFTMTPVEVDHAPAGIGSICVVGHGSGSSTGSAAGTAR